MRDLLHVIGGKPFFSGRMLLIEESSPGRYRLTNGPMTIEVFGKSVEDVLLQGMEKVLGGGEVLDVFRNSYSTAMVLDSLMGKPEPVSWNQNGAEVEGQAF